VLASVLQQKGAAVTKKQLLTELLAHLEEALDLLDDNLDAAVDISNIGSLILDAQYLVEHELDSVQLDLAEQKNTLTLH
jgi:hypothetical protein